MAFVHGRFTKVWCDAYNLTSYLTEGSTSQSIDLAEIVTFGAAAKQYLSGLPDGTASFSGYFDGTAGAVDPVLSAAVGATNANVVTFTPQGTAATAGMARLFAGRESSYEVSASAGEVVGVTAEFQADGPIEVAQVLANEVVVSATGTTTSVLDLTNAATTNGAVCHLHCTANTRNGAITVLVEHSTNDSTYTTLGTFTDITAATPTSQRLVIAPGTTVNKYLRVNWSAVGGSTGSATITVAVARR